MLRKEKKREKQRLRERKNDQLWDGNSTKCSTQELTFYSTCSNEYSSFFSKAQQSLWLGVATGALVCLSFGMVIQAVKWLS